MLMFSLRRVARNAVDSTIFTVVILTGVNGMVPFRSCFQYKTALDRLLLSSILSSK